MNFTLIELKIKEKKNGNFLKYSANITKEKLIELEIEA